jgi:hypothetical protein
VGPACQLLPHLAPGACTGQAAPPGRGGRAARSGPWRQAAPLGRGRGGTATGARQLGRRWTGCRDQSSPAREAADEGAAAWAEGEADAGGKRTATEGAFGAEQG